MKTKLLNNYEITRINNETPIENTDIKKQTDVENNKKNIVTTTFRPKHTFKTTAPLQRLEALRDMSLYMESQHTPSYSFKPRTTPKPELELRKYTVPSSGFGSKAGVAYLAKSPRQVSRGTLSPRLYVNTVSTGRTASPSTRSPRPYVETASSSTLSPRLYVNTVSTGRTASPSTRSPRPYATRLSSVRPNFKPHPTTTSKGLVSPKGYPTTISTTLSPRPYIRTAPLQMVSSFSQSPPPASTLSTPIPPVVVKPLSIHLYAPVNPSPIPSIPDNASSEFVYIIPGSSFVGIGHPTAAPTSPVSSNGVLESPGSFITNVTPKPPSRNPRIRSTSSNPSIGTKRPRKSFTEVPTSFTTAFTLPSIHYTSFGAPRHTKDITRTPSISYKPELIAREILNPPQHGFPSTTPRYPPLTPRPPPVYNPTLPPLTPSPRLPPYTPIVRMLVPPSPPSIHTSHRPQPTPSSSIHTSHRPQSTPSSSIHTSHRPQPTPSSSIHTSHRPQPTPSSIPSLSSFHHSSLVRSHPSRPPSHHLRLPIPSHTQITTPSPLPLPLPPSPLNTPHLPPNQPNSPSSNHAHQPHNLHTTTRPKGFYIPNYPNLELTPNSPGQQNIPRSLNTQRNLGLERFSKTPRPKQINLRLELDTGKGFHVSQRPPPRPQVRSRPKPVRIETTIRPVDIYTSSRPLDIRTSPRPLDIHTTPRPLDIRTSPRPLDIHTTPRPLDIHTTPRPLNIHTTPRPLDIHTTPRPTQHHTLSKPQYSTSRPRFQDFISPKQAIRPFETPHSPIRPEFIPFQPTKRPLGPEFIPFQSTKNPLGPKLNPYLPHQTPLGPDFTSFGPTKRPLKPKSQPTGPFQPDYAPNGPVRSNFVTSGPVTELASTGPRVSGPRLPRPRLPRPRLHGPYDNQQSLGIQSSRSELGRRIPGIPGLSHYDYPIYSTLPETPFSCSDKHPGYYADQEARCQVFHNCQIGGRMSSFLCPNGTVFNQRILTCDHWRNVRCDKAVHYYIVNKGLYVEQNKNPYNNNAKRQSEKTRLFKHQSTTRKPIIDTHITNTSPLIDVSLTATPYFTSSTNSPVITSSPITTSGLTSSPFSPPIRNTHVTTRPSIRNQHVTTLPLIRTQHVTTRLPINIASLKPIPLFAPIRTSHVTAPLPYTAAALTTLPYDKPITDRRRSTNYQITPENHQITPKDRQITLKDRQITPKFTEDAKSGQNRDNHPIPLTLKPHIVDPLKVKPFFPSNGGVGT
ncbi:mucin-2-like [Homarus americanus]|nr:mucin-2-like [Homarus americanus]